MDEKEIKDPSELENEDIDDGLVEVVEEEVNEVDESYEDNNPNNQYPSSTNKLTTVIYLVIFVSILIWVYFYVKQNPDLLNQITGKESTQTWETNTSTWEENIIDSTDTWITNDNTNLENIDNNTLINEWANSNKDPSNTTTSSTWTTTEEVIIEDFEKELDSLFDAIDENAK